MGGLAHNLHEMIKKSLITLHSGASDTVAATKTAVGNTIQNTTGEPFHLILKYTKGTEDGLELYISYPETKASTVYPDECGFESIGGGCLKAVSLFRLFDASSPTDGYKIPVNPNGAKFFKVFQKRNGAVAANGTFELYAEINAIAR